MLFRPVLTENIEELPINMGQLIIDSRNQSIYIDINNSVRKQIISSEGGSSYSREEIDEMLDNIRDIFNNYYTSQEINNKFNNYYTKNEIDEKLNEIKLLIGNIEDQLSEV